MRPLLITLLLLATGATLSAQSTIVLQPGPEDGKDAMVWDDPLYNKASRNYAEHTEMLVHAWTDQGVPVYARSYIAFDLSDIRRRDLLSAELILANNPEGTSDGEHQPWSGPNRAFIRRVITPWTEQEISWDNQPSYTDYHQVLMPASVNGHQTYHVDVTELLRDMLYRFPDRSHGFVILLEEESHYRALVFATSDYPVEEKRPKLILRFAGATPVKRVRATAPMDLTVYPNPASEQIDVHAVLPAGSQGHVELLDAVGQVLRSWQVHKSTVLHVPLGGLPPGQYWVRLGNNASVTVKAVAVH